MDRAGEGIPRRTLAAGFTLIEAVVVIVIIGIVAGVVGLFVGSPVLGFMHQARRAALTDAADLALLRMSRDLRAALPNSLRVSGNSAIELLHTLDGDRYRVEPPGGEDDRLTPGEPDRAFNTLAPLGGSDPLPAAARLAIYPLGQAGANPWIDPVVTPPGLGLTRTTAEVGGVSESRLTLDAPHRFPLDSPSRRVFLVGGAVSYLCSGERLLRYAGYDPSATQPASEAAFAARGATGSVIVDSLEPGSCDFRYAASLNSQRNAVARLTLVLNRDGERLRLLRQVHVDNTP